MCKHYSDIISGLTGAKVIIPGLIHEFVIEGILIAATIFFSDDGNVLFTQSVLSKVLLDFLQRQFISTSLLNISP